MISFGLTGGIGSGKSTVSAMLAARGAVILDADQMSREVVEPGSDGLAKIIERFGQQLILPDGQLDRTSLASIVFSDAAARGALNTIVHPAVGKLMMERLAAQEATDNVVVLDVPLLFESGGRDRYELAGVLVVDSPVETAIERIVASRATSREDAEARMAAQLSRTDRIAQADYLIVNSGTLAELSVMVERAWDWMLGLRNGPDDAQVVGKGS